LIFHGNFLFAISILVLPDDMAALRYQFVLSLYFVKNA